MQSTELRNVLSDPRRSSDPRISRLFSVVNMDTDTAVGAVTLKVATFRRMEF